MGKPMQYRQGDVLLVAVKSVPKGATEAKRDMGRVVLAYGESTGHAHAISSEHASMFLAGGQQVLRVERPDKPEPAETIIRPWMSFDPRAALLRLPDGQELPVARIEVRGADTVAHVLYDVGVVLRHEEHDPHFLKSGLYQRVPQAEYVPGELARVVAD